MQTPHGLRSRAWRWGGHELYLGAEKTRSQLVLVIAQGKILENAAREAPRRSVYAVLLIFEK
jgi:hypothetical protein